LTAEVVVIADDFTGGNAAAAGFRRTGMRAATVNLNRLESAASRLVADFDVVVVITDARHATGPEVANAVCLALDRIGPARLVCNRIDTTLRGSIGESSAAALRHVRRALPERRVVALCVPAHPAAGRQTVGGVQLLDGVRLEETEVAHDPLDPILHSEVDLVLSRGTDLSVAKLGLNVVTSSSDRLPAELRDVAGSCDVIVVDALTEAHLDRVARAAAQIDQEIAWMGVDPGPFSAALARRLGIGRSHGASRSPVLMVSGSATRLTIQQLRTAISERRVVSVQPYFVDRAPGRLDTERTTEAVKTALRNAESGDVVLLATALDDAHVLPVDRQTATALAADLAAITRAAISACVIGGLYTTGGDVTVSVLHELDAEALEAEGEVMPLAVAGRLVGGPWAGLPVVTKGGLVGGADAALRCIDHLELMKTHSH
jgi:uncharacterized protein YgbK (DUF1537 family)